ncbi:MAG: universal stress protein [Candidatus Scalindua sp.]|jgi:nucleotide-binding universal stress UspA family protein|nr:universal stress protein [Candidatus Scalindua sp.]MBT5304985.1 universal stress protein [Candidatus Scalindua sp.]MBT6048587.1 universal stress protein [Candidatus Scalindua sp.]MBT6226336.1 universal stress protein [Candidatus Scalindua sp.]MBT6562484.1 universal stress protein [Candidatus Scalindua sp.]
MISLKKILCPIDHSDCSKEALKYAVSFAMRDEAKLYLLHIIDIRSFNESLNAMPTQIPDNETLEQLRIKLLDCIPEEMRDDMDVEAIVIQGIPFVEIISTSREKEIDMIVMGSHGRTGISHMMLGSVSEKVVRKAPCPVLIVRQPDQKFVMP